jgi:hypothetical protein
MRKMLPMLINKSKILRSFFAVVAAILWWGAYESYRVIERAYTIPCCVYYQDSEKHAHLDEAPEMIQVQLRGTRRALRTLDTESLAAHIDGILLEKGKQQLLITEENLFLPPTIKLINWSPSNSYLKIS